MKRKLFSFIIVLAMMFTTISFAFAESSQGRSEEEFEKHNQHILQKQKEVLSILDELATYRNQKILNQEVNSFSEKDSYVAELESRLIHLGGRKLTQGEIQELRSRPNSELDYSPEGISPSALTDNTDWWQYEWEDVYYNGKEYTVRQYYLQALNGGSSLFEQRNAQYLYTNGNTRVVDIIADMVTIYMMKVAGMNKIINLLPTELIQNHVITPTTYTDYHMVNYSGYTTMCFSYVTEQNGWGIEYKTHVTNSVKYSIAHVIHFNLDGAPKNDLRDDSGTVYSDDYASIYKPLEFYVTKGPGNMEANLINWFTVYNHDNTKELWLPVSAPDDPVYVY